MQDINLYSFEKKEKVTGKKRIDNLFENGSSFVSYPLRVVYFKENIQPESESLISVMVSIPKKRIKLSVRRNRLKRLIREAYRQNKSRLYDYCLENGIRCDIAFVYLKDEIVDYENIRKSVVKALETIMK